MSFNRILIVVVFSAIVHLHGQAIGLFTVRDSITTKALPGATVAIPAADVGSITADNGIASFSLSPGEYRFAVSYIGYRAKEVTVRIARDSIYMFTVYLQPVNLELKNVVVSSLRINSEIKSSGKRVEIIGREELDEKVLENPSGTTELLSELSAVSLAQTSSFLRAAGVRMLGLPEKYTLILKDGFPLFSGLGQDFVFSQIPPLNLQQVEIIKGGASSYWGSGAIGGVVNLLTKTPGQDTLTQLILNKNSISANDASLYYAGSVSGVPFTLMTGINTQDAIDINHDGFTEIPNTRNYTFEPQALFNLSPSSALRVSMSFTDDSRSGGSSRPVSQLPYGYSETSSSSAYSLTADYTRTLSYAKTLQVKTGFRGYNLSLGTNSLLRYGSQFSTYTEGSVTENNFSSTLAYGAAIVTDQMKLSTPFRNGLSIGNFGIAVFVHDEFSPFPDFKIQAGARAEFSSRDNRSFVPSLSALFNVDDNTYIRFSFGSGIRLPLQSLWMMLDNDTLGGNVRSLGTESSISLGLEAGTKFILFDDCLVSVNHSFFRASIFNPIDAVRNPSTGSLVLDNALSSIESYGMETNIRASIDDAYWFMGLTFTDVSRQYALPAELPLTPKVKLVSMVGMEVDSSTEIDVGAVLTGKQVLTNGTRTNSYLTAEFLIKKKIRNLLFALNVENIFDVKQSSFGYSSGILNGRPANGDIWAPVEGRYLNLTLLINL